MKFPQGNEIESGVLNLKPSLKVLFYFTRSECSWVRNAREFLGRLTTVDIIWASTSSLIDHPDSHHHAILWLTAVVVVNRFTMISSASRRLILRSKAIQSAARSLHFLTLPGRRTIRVAGPESAEFLQGWFTRTHSLVHIHSYTFTRTHSSRLN